MVIWILVIWEYSVKEFSIIWSPEIILHSDPRQQDNSVKIFWGKFQSTNR